ncbi:MAG: HD domain-containing phosphohydrolase [Pseudomonadota bacterium]
MLLLENVFVTLLNAPFAEKLAYILIDPLALTTIVAPALYFLIFKPLNRQAEIERQIDELRRFQHVAIGRELRIQELKQEIAMLRHPLSDGAPGAAPASTAQNQMSQSYGAIPLTEENQRGALLALLEDLESAHKQIEQAHQEWIAALDVVDAPIFLHDKQFRILRCNRAYQECAGISYQALIGQRYYDVFPKTGAPLAACLRVLAKGGEAADVEELAFGDAIYRSRTYSVFDKQGTYLHSVHILEDITKPKQVEAALKNSEALLNETGRLAKIGGWEFDPQTGQGTWTEEVARIHDMEPGQPTSMEIGMGFYRGESRQRIEAAVKAAIADGTPYDLELEMTTATGVRKWVRTIGQPVSEAGRVIKIGGSYQDITERKLAQAEIEHANRALATLSAVNRTLVHAASEDELLQKVCQAIVEQHGYQLAWVGYAQHDESKSIKIMAHAGVSEGYLENLRLSWGENERGMGPSGRAIRSGEPQLCQDVASDPQFILWRKAALQHGLAASIALPLKNDGVFGMLNVYAAEANAFRSNEVALLEEMADDLSFGVHTQHTRHERDLALEKNQQQLLQLQQSLEDTVRAIATIVELRDPYTAGHQIRVADLATAIARQMGLSEERVHAIHLAGVVHDLGKIQVPAEILSKPGKLNDIEYALIKFHPQAGYEILKGINFPWPIARMVLQHHERLDGSGYPQGLQGDDILLEARILTVADVVEAMSSHRPYRPGWGDEKALEEIISKRGVYYDPRVVDACVTLFRERSYSFSK